MNTTSIERRITIQHQREKIAHLRFVIGACTQNQISDLIHRLRMDYKIWSFPRSIVKWLSRGRFCRHNGFSWTYEILQDAKNTREYAEIESIRKSAIAEITSMEHSIYSMDPEAPADENIEQMIRVLEAQFEG